MTSTGVDEFASAVKDLQEEVKKETKNPDLDTSDSDSDPEVDEKPNSVFKRILRTMITMLLLLGATLGYCYWGATIYSDLEMPVEIQSCIDAREAYMKAKALALERIVLLGEKLQTDDDQKRIRMSGILNAFKADYADSGWGGEDCGKMEPKWTKFGAFVWAATVVSTIGYGHISPVTAQGRLIMIPWSLVGIGLMLATLGKVGSILADLFKLMYQYLCCCKCCRCFAQPLSKRPPATLWRTDANGKPIAFGGTVIVEDSDTDDDDYVEEAFTVPLTVSILMIAFILVIGGMFFQQMEGYKMIDSIYFTYVTLSTIGFGDMVPGVDNLSKFSVKVWMIGACIFIFIGLAWLSMSFQLMQDEVVAKWVLISSKIGCNKEEKPKPKVELDSDDEEKAWVPPVIEDNTSSEYETDTETSSSEYETDTDASTDETSEDSSDEDQTPIIRK